MWFLRSSSLFKYIFKREIKLRFFFYLFPFERQFPVNFIFCIRHTNQFSEQRPPDNLEYTALKLFSLKLGNDQRRIYATPIIATLGSVKSYDFL
jgi:hypothetical protein